MRLQLRLPLTPSSPSKAFALAGPLCESSSNCVPMQMKKSVITNGLGWFGGSTLKTLSIYPASWFGYLPWVHGGPSESKPCRTKEIVATRLNPLPWMPCKRVNVMVSCSRLVSLMTGICPLLVTCSMSRMAIQWSLLKLGAIECKAMGGQEIMPLRQAWIRVQILHQQALQLPQITLMPLCG